MAAGNAGGGNRTAGDTSSATRFTGSGQAMARQARKIKNFRILFSSSEIREKNQKQLKNIIIPVNG